MKNMFYNNDKDAKSGFTLIELLVVIAIIGILASVVLVSLNTARQKARDSRRVADMRTLQLALSLYFDDNNAYPVQAAGEMSAATSALLDDYVQGGKLPCDPSVATGSCAADGGTGYAYYGTASVYHIGANLESPTHAQLSNDADINSGFDGADGGALTLVCGIVGFTTPAGVSCYDLTQ